MKPAVIRGARVLFVAIVLLALAVFIFSLDWRATWLVVRGADVLLLIVAAIVSLLSLAAKAVRWWIFLRRAGAPSMRLAMRATFAGAALNNLLVANGGEAARVIYVARETHTRSERILATMALERLFEFVGFFALLAFAVSAVALPFSPMSVRIVALGVLVLLGAFLFWLARHPEMAELPVVVEGEGLLHRAREYGRGFARTLANLSTPGRFAGALGMTAISWGLQVVTYHLTAMAAGIDITVAGTVACLLSVNVGFAIRATPGNVGVFQMAYAVAAGAFGVDRDAAMGAALLIQTQQIIPTTVIGLLAAPGMLRAKRRKTAREGNVLPDEPAAAVQ